MTARYDSHAHQQWCAAVRDRLLTAHPADVRECGQGCNGSGEVPHEDGAIECRACLGTGLELDEVTPRDCDAPVDAVALARASAFGRAA